MSSSRRWRSRRTTRSGSRSSRSCGRACSRRGSARPRASTRRCATTAYWVALLRYVGCTGHAHEVATVFGDEIAIRAQTLVHDAANPAEVMRDVMAFATAGRGPEERDEIVRMIQETAREWAVHNFSSGLRGGRHARASGSTSAPTSATRCAFTFERWNGNGYPDARAGRGDPARRCASSTSATTWRRSAASSRRSALSRPLASAATARTTRRSPTSSSRMGATGSTGSARPSRGTPCSRSSPSRIACWTGAELDDALTVVADFIDLKSPYMGGHSRRCAELAADAARRARARRGGRHRAPPRGARARLRHHRGAELDLGQARPAHADRVRPGRASPDADRADAAPFAGAGAS